MKTSRVFRQVLSVEIIWRVNADGRDAQGAEDTGFRDWDSIVRDALSDGGPVATPPPMVGGLEVGPIEELAS